MPESKSERAGGDVWGGIADSFKCDNCNQPFDNDAVIDKGKHPIFSFKKRGYLMLCNKCYVLWREQKHPDPEKKKLV